MIVTGEASGDLHGANLIRSYKKISPQDRFFGVGGKRMSKEGCELLIQSEDLAVMGLFEVLFHLPRIWKSFQYLKKQFFGENPPDALVLIDFPEFNLRLAKQAKKAGIPVLYYVSPQVWAWRRGRVKKIAKIVDVLAAIFPFEPKLYEGLDIDVQYVGHPLIDEYSHEEAGQGIGKLSNIPKEKKIIGLFPGSRQNEIHYMLQTLVNAAKIINEQLDDVQFLVPVAGSLSRDMIESAFSTDLPITYIDTNETSIYQVAHTCDAILTVSGTVTLQIALMETPIVFFYQLWPLSYAIGKKLVQVEHIGLVNIVAEQRVVPEFIQNDAKPETLAAAVLQFFQDKNYALEVASKLKLVKTRLGQPGCSDRVAKILYGMLVAP